MSDALLLLQLEQSSRDGRSSLLRPARTAPVASCKAAASPSLRALAQGSGLAGTGLGMSSHVQPWRRRTKQAGRALELGRLAAKEGHGRAAVEALLYMAVR